MSKTKPKNLRDKAAEPEVRRIRADQRKATSERLRAVLKTVRKRFLDPSFDVSALWREHGIRHKGASTWFTTEVGQPPKLYLTERRLGTAARLLDQTDLKVDQIGKLSGYAACSTFGHAFKKAYGCSPWQYRHRPPPDPTDGPFTLDPEELDQAVAGKLTPLAGAELSRRLRRLGKHLETLGGPPAFDAVLAAADRAAAAADYDAALRQLDDAEDHPGGAGQETAVARRRTLAWHGRGSLRALDGDVDRGFEDLARARGGYAAAGEWPPPLQDLRRRLESRTTSHDTDAALLEALCPDCRALLLSDAGRTTRDHLRRALEPVPVTLEWLHQACDACYRVVWKALGLARLAFLDDAFTAWWLVQKARPHLGSSGAPPSVGRVAAALAEVEERVSGDQKERLAYCDLALDDAAALGDPFLKSLARVWRGRVLTALARHPEAREEFRRAAAERQGAQGPARRWLEALQKGMEGLLADATNDYPGALELLAAAARLYEVLDPHLTGLLYTQQANVFFFQAEYRRAIATDQAASLFLDGRRDPLQETAVLPIHLAGAFGALGEGQTAELALGRCAFDRTRHPAFAAAETFTRGCLFLGQGRAEEAVDALTDAKTRFEELHRPRTAALASTYSVEAYARLGRRPEAVAAARAAARFFQAAGCPQDTLMALAQLRELLESETIDGTAVTATVRRLARLHGGWLPDQA